MTPTREQVEEAYNRAEYCRDKGHCNHLAEHGDTYETLTARSLCVLADHARSLEARVKKLEAENATLRYREAKLVEAVLGRAKNYWVHPDDASYFAPNHLGGEAVYLSTADMSDVPGWVRLDVALALPPSSSPSEQAKIEKCGEVWEMDRPCPSCEIEEPCPKCAPSKPGEEE